MRNLYPSHLVQFLAQKKQVKPQYVALVASDEVCDKEFCQC